jgi:hypothetical protein
MQLARCSQMMQEWMRRVVLCGFLGVMEMLVGPPAFLLRTLGQMTVDQGVGVGVL